MQQNQGKEEEKVWWVRYVYKQDLALAPGAAPKPGNAFFYAVDEEALDKQLAGWQRYIKRDGVVVQGIEQVSHDFRLEFYLGPLPQLPPEKAKAVLLVYRERESLVL